MSIEIDSCTYAYAGPSKEKQAPLDQDREKYNDFCIGIFKKLSPDEQITLYRNPEDYNSFCTGMFKELSSKDTTWLQENSQLTHVVCKFMCPYLLEKGQKKGSKQIKKIKDVRNRIKEACNASPNENLRKSAFYLQGVLKSLTERTLSPTKNPSERLWKKMGNYFSGETANEYNARIFLAGLWNVVGNFELAGKTHTYEEGFTSEFCSLIERFLSHHYKNFLNLKMTSNNLSTEIRKEVTDCLYRVNDSIDSKVESIMKGELTIVQGDWENHIVQVVFYKDLVIKVNRGKGAEDSPGLVVYRRKKPYDSSVLKETLIKLQKISVLEKVWYREGRNARLFFDYEIDTTLGLEQLFWIPQTHQQSENCWAKSFCSAVLASLYAPLFKDYLELEIGEKEAHAQAVSHAFEIYKKATAYVKIQAEDDYKSSTKNPDQALLNEIEKVKEEHPERFSLLSK